MSVYDYKSFSEFCLSRVNILTRIVFAVREYIIIMVVDRVNIMTSISDFSESDSGKIYCIIVLPLVPLCRGEAGLLVTPKYGYFCNLFPLVSVVSLFSPPLFLLCLSQISLHTVFPS